MLTPMNGIIGLAQYLEGTELDPDQSECVTDVLKSGDRMLNMVRQVLEFVEADATSTRACLANLNLHAIAGQVLAEFQPRAEGKGLTLQLPAPPAPVHAIGDARLFAKVLAGLVDNAIKFSSCGTIRIELARVDATDADHDGWARCSVVDAGSGVPTDRQQQIFRPFSQTGGS